MVDSHFDQVVALAQEQRPDLTKAIIAILSERADKRSLLHLAAFRRFKSDDLRMETVRALSAVDQSLAQRILSEFLQDDAETIRIKAANSIRMFEDPAALHYLFKTARERAFHRRTFAEKKAVLSCLARFGGDEAMPLLRALLLKAGFFGRSRRDETRLAAANALASSPTSGAVEILSEGLRSSKKAAAGACRKAFRRIGNPPKGEEIPS
jgi:HEAT repeat protein